MGSFFYLNGNADKGILQPLFQRARLDIPYIGIKFIEVFGNSLVKMHPKGNFKIYTYEKCHF